MQWTLVRDWRDLLFYVKLIVLKKMMVSLAPTVGLKVDLTRIVME